MAKSRGIEQQKFLRYVTRMDNKVRDSHAILNYVVKKVTDSFWDIYTPPNGWNCRCRLEKLQSSGLTSTNTTGLNLHKAVPDIFRFNAAKEGVVFSPKHPYYKIPQKDLALAKKNFNLPRPNAK